MEQGTVKWFNDTKGYGFIRGSDGRDIFVHHTDIESDGFRTLAEGQAVQFVLADGPKGPKANQVRPVAQ